MNFIGKLVPTVIAAFLLTAAAPLPANTQPPKIGLVNFKTCVEKSKAGKQEQTNFENMKKQMESVLEEKEKTLTDLSKKLNDSDYLDSLSQEAEADLKHKFRSLNQEMAQHQQQFYQVLQQSNYKIIQKLSEQISEASKIVAKNRGLDLILNEEGSFYFAPTLDISEDIVKAMDSLPKKDEKK